MGGTGRWPLWRGGPHSSADGWDEYENICALALRWVGGFLCDQREAFCGSSSPGWRHPHQGPVVGPSISEIPEVTGDGKGLGTAAVPQFSGDEPPVLAQMLILGVL